MAWPLTGSALTKYNRLLSDLRQYGDFIFVGAPDDITWLQEIIVAASDGELRPSLDDVANRSHFWMLELSRVLGEKVVVCPECPPVVPCPPCPDSSLTTTPSGLEDTFGFFNIIDDPSLTGVVFHRTNISGGGIDIQNQTGLISVSAPNLVTMNGGASIQVFSSPALTGFSLPALTTLENISYVQSYFNSALTSFSLPALTTVDNGAVIQATTNAALTTVSLGSVIFGDGTSYDFSANALTDSSVNHVLARGVASVLYVSGTIDLSGGTNSAPTGQGIVDKATLIGRGVTVTTN